MNPLEPPRMTVLSDQPMQADARSDSLDLAVKLGPVYDILRHPDTRTPLAMAIYGDWGTGKTSAMKWLEGLLREWNGHVEDERGTRSELGKIVRPVWFYPWKYDDKNDVWRGLIAEVILASIDAREATQERVLTAVKQFGKFLGRSFMHVLSRMKLVDGMDVVKVAKDISEEYQKYAHPEAGYLNQFETTLRMWIKDTISDAGERMVIFIDDLDRCMPEVALQVLEALKLYLNIDDLIFVIGVDRSVVDQLIQKLYAKLGLQPEKSKHYLAKMFQVEVVIGPNEQQAESFLDTQLAAISERTNQYWTRELVDRQRAVLRKVVLHLAARNPREIKRLLNSVLIHGAGVLRVAEQPFSFAQGMQIFLVRKILDERYTMGLNVDTRTGMSFFNTWSKIVQHDDAPRTVKHPEVWATRLLRATGGGESTDSILSMDLLDSITGAQKAALAQQGAADTSERLDTPYVELLTEPRYSHLWMLLADEELGELMTVEEYPADTTVLAAAALDALPRGLIHEAILRQIGRPASSELTPEDYKNIQKLDVAGEEIDDVTALQVLTGLEHLNLAFTEVEDIRPLAGLRELQVLVLSKTQVSELVPLRKLRHLRELSLAHTRVEDLSPLASLRELEVLNLQGTKVSDLSPLADMSQLHELVLANTRVTDLEPLRSLSALREVYLDGCDISDEQLQALEQALPGATIHH